jgi:hypothetical protein
MWNDSFWARKSHPAQGSVLISTFANQHGKQQRTDADQSQPDVA